MKTLLKTLFLILISISAFAQSDEHKVIVGFHTGYSPVSLLENIITGINVENSRDNIDASLTPALQLTADFSLNRFVSLGLAVSHQTVSIDATDFNFIDIDTGLDRIATFQTTFRRSQVAIRSLYHYVNSEKIDLYSGLRLGWVTRSFNDFEGEDIEGITEEIFNPDTRPSPFIGGAFSFSITAFGMRYFFADNIGAGFEINLVNPYIANVGISARF